MNNYYLYQPIKMMSVKDGRIKITTIDQATVYARYQNIFKPTNYKSLPTYYFTIADLLDEIECHRVAVKCRAKAIKEDIKFHNLEDYGHLYTMYFKILPQLLENKLSNIAEYLFNEINREAEYLTLDRKSCLKNNAVPL